MKVAIQLSVADEVKAPPILLRHSPGMVLPNRTYVINAEAAKSLRAAGVFFTETHKEDSEPTR